MLVSVSSLGITHQLTGKIYFQAWAMDVKLDGKNVCRHIDITTSNHGSAPPGSPPAPSTETQTMKDAQEAVDAGKCPCCGKPLHPWQQDENGKPFTPIKENDFWQKKIDQVPNLGKRGKFQKNFGLMKEAKGKLPQRTLERGERVCHVFRHPQGRQIKICEFYHRGSAGDAGRDGQAHLREGRQERGRRRLGGRQPGHDLERREGESQDTFDGWRMQQPPDRKSVV